MRKINFWNNKRVLITGHEGFLGSNLAVTLLKLGARIIGIDKAAARPVSVLNGWREKITAITLDIQEYRKVKAIITGKKPAVIFHFAAEAIVGRAKRDPLSVFKSNVEGTWNILESCRGQKSVRSVVVASSDKAYGTSKRLPYTEMTPLAGTHTYDASKACEDIIAQAYYHSYKVPVAILRCGNIYGPGDFNFSRLIPDAIQCGLTGRRLIVRSDGRFTRDFVFVDDVIRAYMDIAANINNPHVAGQAFNVSNENPLRVMAVVRAIGRLCGIKMKRPKILKKAHDEIHDQYLSARKIRAVLGWEPSCTFEEGLKRTIEWYREAVG